MTWLWPSLLVCPASFSLTRSCSGIEQDFGPIGAGSLAVGQGSARSLGFRVTANQSSCRRRWPTTRNANRHSNVSVGPTQRSLSAIASAWLRRNVRQVCDGGPRRPDLGDAEVRILPPQPAPVSSPALVDRAIKATVQQLSSSRGRDTDCISRSTAASQFRASSADVEGPDSDIRGARQ